MKSEKKEKAVIYLDRQRLDFYGGHIKDKIIHLDFPTNIIANIDIIKKDELNILIKAFIDFYKITPTKTLMILSKNIYFEKVFDYNKQNYTSEDLQKFLSAVPFENILERSYDTKPREKTVISANMDLVNGIRIAFEEQKFVLEAVLPELFLTKDLKTSEKMSVQSAEKILSRFDSYKNYNMLGQETKQAGQKVSSEEKKPNDVNKKEKSKLIILLPLFLLLVGFLVYLLYRNSQPVPNSKNKNIPKINKTSTTPQIPPTKAEEMNIDYISQGTESAKKTENNIRIKIINGSNIADQEDIIKEQLESLGFDNIEAEQSSSINTPQTLLLMSSRLTTDTKNLLSKKITTMFENVSIQESEDNRYEVVIIIGTSE